MMKFNNETYFSAGELAKLTGYLPRRILRAITKGNQYGKLPAIILGRMYYVKPEDFTAYTWVEGNQAGEARQAVQFSVKGAKHVVKGIVPVISHAKV